MNIPTHTTRPASPPAPFKHADDEVSRAKAIITTVWLAMSSESFDAEDIEALGDTVYEAIQRLSNAEKLLGVHHDR